MKTESSAHLAIQKAGFRSSTEQSANQNAHLGFTRMNQLGLASRAWLLAKAATKDLWTATPAISSQSSGSFKKVSAKPFAMTDLPSPLKIQIIFVKSATETVRRVLTRPTIA